MPANVAIPVGGNPAAASGLIKFQLADDLTPSIPAEIVGWSVTESTGSAGAKVRFHDGANASAPILGAEVNLTTGQSLETNFPEGLVINSGKVYLEVVSGSVEVAVYW